MFLVNKLTWEGLDDELDEADLTTIMDRLKVLLDRREYLVGFLLRWFYGVDDTVLPTLSTVTVLGPYAASRSVEVRHSLADQALRQRDAVLEGLAQMELRRPGRAGAAEFRLALDNAAGPEGYRAADLQALSFDLLYTDLICSQLAAGEYGLLLRTLPDLVRGPGAGFAFPVQNISLLDMLRRWDVLFNAMARVISVVGTERQKGDARRFMEARKAFLDAVSSVPLPQPPPPPPAPPPGAFAGAFLTAVQQAVQAIQTTLTGAAGTFADLARTVQDIANSVDDISAAKLLGNLEDDRAVAAIGTMSQQGLLAFLPTEFKVELVNRALGGSDIIPAVVDEEEDAVLAVLRETKARSAAEFLQVAASATWERLDDALDGTQRDELAKLFKF